MKHPIILDACTIINLLRIDDMDDRFLYNHIISLNLHIAEMVQNEVKANFRKNDLSKEDTKTIDKAIEDFRQHLLSHNGFHLDCDIINGISSDYFNKIKECSKYEKRDNGELLSAALALLLSRNEATRVFFYTDDNPARILYSPFFSLQQIGTILDTVDLLIFLYWSIKDFKLKDLDKYLSNLWEDVNQPLKKMINEIIEIQGKTSHINKLEKNTKTYVQAIIEGYKELNVSNISKAIAQLKQQKKTSNIVGIINKYPYIEKECELICKIRETRAAIKKQGIYKLP